MLQSMRTVFSWIEWDVVFAGNIVNAFLEVYTKEKISLFAGPELGDFAGDTLLVSKLLYGFRSGSF